MNKIYLRRANRIVVPQNSGGYIHIDSPALVASIDANLRRLGYALHGDVVAALLQAPVQDITRIGKALIKEVKEIKGVRRYSPMYPNFPRQVMEASDAELYLNAVVHYFGTATGIRILPAYPVEARPELNFDESAVTIIGLGSDSDFYNLMSKLAASKSGFSETDKADIKALGVRAFREAVLTLRDFANRENKAFLAAEAYNRGLGIHRFVFDTATDVLRFAVALSDGDTSLAENTKFRNFKRTERRLLLDLLEKVQGDIVEDMLRHAQTWKRLGERLHPGEFREYVKANRGFAAVRENSNAQSFNARVEKALADRDPLGAARILRARPGEFARRLDAVLRLAETVGVQREVLHTFEQVAAKASPTVLVQARNAFVNRDKDVRVFFPKGRVAKMQSVKDERPALRKSVVAEAVKIFDDALTEAFKGRADLGGAWVDPALKGIAIPFGQRSASKAIKTLGRGSRLALGDDTNVVRFFIWWKDAESGGWGYGSHTDIDLSAVCFDGDFHYHSGITYYNLREQGAVHSGDITSAPDGASEFIDIDVDTLRSRGVRYVAMTLHSYSGQGFVELPECFAGFMERKDLDSGEIYDPRTVTNKVDLTANTRGATPFIFDLETGEAIWVDLSMQISSMAGNVANSKGQITSLVQAMTTLTPPNMYDLFTAHAAARGGIVSKEKAKTIFSFDGDVTPFDTELILDEYL